MQIYVILVYNFHFVNDLILFTQELPELDSYKLIQLFLFLT
jgi:hypothetical protein